MKTLDTGGVTVDSDFLRIGGKSYAISKITSVDVRRRPSTWRGVALLLVIVAVVLLAAHAIVGTALAGALAGLIFWKAGPTATLMIATSSSETAALSSKDTAGVDALRSSIETAMAAR